MLLKTILYQNLSTLNFDPANVSHNLCDAFLPMKSDQIFCIAFSIRIGFFVVKDHLGLFFLFSICFEWACQDF